MDLCCLHSHALRFMESKWHVPDEGEGHTCRFCGKVYRIVNGKWQESLGQSTTINVFSEKDQTIDFGWARGTRLKDGILVQCWGCGATMMIPDQSLVEFHFDHVDPKCSLAKAMVNKSKNAMPKVRGH